MKTLILIIALAVGAHAQNSASDLGINASYDKFKDISTVKLTESLFPDRPGYVLLSVVAQIKGQDIEHTPPHSVAIAILSFTDEWYFLKTDNTLRVIQDDQRYELGKMERVDSEVVRGGVRELLVIKIPFSAVEKLSKGNRVEIQVGRYEAALNPSAIINLKNWVKLFPRKPK